MGPDSMANGQPRFVHTKRIVKNLFKKFSSFFKSDAKKTPKTETTPRVVKDVYEPEDFMV